MLPDFSETKRLFGRFLQKYIRQKARSISPFADVRMSYLHEGRGMKIIRADQSESNTEVQQLSSEMTVSSEEIPGLTLEKVLTKFDDMILDLVRKQTGLVLQQLSDELPASQIVDAKGRKLNAEIVLDMLETIQMDFLPNGCLHKLHLVGNLFTPEQFKIVDEQFQNSPDLQKRYNELIERKREEWCVREALRKLVG